MTTSPHQPSGPAWKPLDPRQRRVLGVLVEKAKTTPAAYPMSVNAIVAGCNQKSNRDPLTAYDDTEVEQALDQLRVMGVVQEIDWMGRVAKYKQSAYEWMGVSKVELAVLAELLLRGAQSLGDLRARAARMEPIEDVSALKTVVDALVARGLMLELTPPGRGQIVSHALYPDAEREQLIAHPIGAQASHGIPSSADGSGGGSRALEAEVRELRAEVAELRERVETLEARLLAAGY